MLEDWALRLAMGEPPTGTGDEGGVTRELRTESVGTQMAPAATRRCRPRDWAWRAESSPGSSRLPCAPRARFACAPPYRTCRPRPLCGVLRPALARRPVSFASSRRVQGLRVCLQIAEAGPEPAKPAFPGNTTCRSQGISPSGWFRSPGAQKEHFVCRGRAPDTVSRASRVSPSGQQEGVLRQPSDRRPPRAGERQTSTS